MFVRGPVCLPLLGTGGIGGRLGGRVMGGGREGVRSALSVLSSELSLEGTRTTFLWVEGEPWTLPLPLTDVLLTKTS